MYLQSKAEYGLTNGDFIKICLSDRRNSFYYGTTLGKQFLALQNTSAFFDKKNWPAYKKCFSRRAGVIVERDLKQMEVV